MVLALNIGQTGQKQSSDVSSVNGLLCQSCDYIDIFPFRKQLKVQSSFFVLNFSKKSLKVLIKTIADFD